MRQLSAGTLLILLFIGAPIAADDQFSDEAIQNAFAKSADGFSSDELLLQDKLRDRFLSALSLGSTLKPDQQRAALLKLLQLRKSGKLATKATRRGKPVSPAVGCVAEIAARVVTDRHRITSDTMLADPRLRTELQQEAEKIRPGVDPYSVRKAVLQLRKQRALRPELVLKVADWSREIKTYALEDLRKQIAADRIPKRPGIYLFRDVSGYLYVGEAADVSKRLNEHINGSDRKSLADFLAGTDAAGVSIEIHLFPSNSPASKLTVRRAYESELIRSRNPKFNVRP